MKFNSISLKKKPVTLFIGLLLIFTPIIILTTYITSPIDKQGLINTAKSQSCPVKLSFLHGKEFRYFEECIEIIGKNYFHKFSLEDKKDIAINFIAYADLQGGRSVAFLEMIDPFKKDLMVSLENISDSELNLKYHILNTDINQYRQKIKHYKTILFNRPIS